jgi:hypothetical protein
MKRFMSRSSLSLVLATLIAIPLSACTSLQQAAQKGWQNMRRGKATLTLDQRERWLLEQIYGSTFDPEPVQLIYASPISAGAAKTIKNEIHFPPKNVITDPSYRGSQEFVMLLVHESTHIWQFQNVGLRYMADSLYHQGKGHVDHGDRNLAYHYQLLPGKPFNRYNSEQQAKIIEEYVGLKVYDELLRVCDNCASFTRSEYFAFVEAMIRRDVNPDFRGLDGDAVRTTMQGN